MKYETLIYEKEGNIVTITFNRPDKLNTVTKDLNRDIQAALVESEEDDDVKVVILKGAGPCFCAGHDLNEPGRVYGWSDDPKARRPSQRIRLRWDRRNLSENHRNLFFHPKVTICQVHGYCLEEGLYMMTLCDLAIASEDAQIGHVGQRLGFAGSTASTIPILIMNIGLKKALELLLTGKIISGKEAEELGLVNKAVPLGKLEEEVRKLAEGISLMPADGIAIGKAARHMMYEAMGLTCGFPMAYMSHTMFTNVRYEPGEFMVFKERKDRGTKGMFHYRDSRYAGVV